jgi:uncharacterized protein (TIGR03118 family)
MIKILKLFSNKHDSNINYPRGLSVFNGHLWVANQEVVTYYDLDNQSSHLVRALFSPTKIIIPLQKRILLIMFEITKTPNHSPETANSMKLLINNFEKLLPKTNKVVDIFINFLFRSAGKPINTNLHEDLIEFLESLSSNIPDFEKIGHQIEKIIKKIECQSAVGSRQQSEVRSRQQSVIEMVIEKNNLTKYSDIVFNPTKGYVISNKSGCSISCLLIGVTECGVIWGYHPQIDLSILPIIDNSLLKCVYTSLALTETKLCIADFFNQRIDIYDYNFRCKKDTMVFIDPTIPDSYSPYTIRYIHGNIYILYVKQHQLRREQIVAGACYGYVSVFTSEGAFIKRLISQGVLNAPTAIITVPERYKDYAGRLLIGNHGDGQIHVFDFEGNYCNPLMDANQKPIIINKLWGLFSDGQSIYWSSTANTVGKIRL